MGKKKHTTDTAAQPKASENGTKTGTKSTSSRFDEMLKDYVPFSVRNGYMTMEEWVNRNRNKERTPTWEL